MLSLLRPPPVQLGGEPIRRHRRTPGGPLGSFLDPRETDNGPSGPLGVELSQHAEQREPGGNRALAVPAPGACGAAQCGLRVDRSTAAAVLGTPARVLSASLYAAA